MMTEISLNVLDVSENSTRAGASLVTILVTADTSADKLTIVIADNGCGMTPEQAAHVTDPFFTTRTTRKVGLGIPFSNMPRKVPAAASILNRNQVREPP